MSETSRFVVVVKWNFLELCLQFTGSSGGDIRK